MAEDPSPASQDHLEPIGPGQPIVAPLTLRRRWWRQPRTWVIVGVVVVVALVALYIGWRNRPGAGESPYLTAEAVEGSVVSTVSASGEVVDEYTYSVAPGATPLLAAHYGVPPDASGGGVGTGDGLEYLTTSIVVGVGDLVTAGQTIATAQQPAARQAELQRAVDDAQARRDSVWSTAEITQADSQLAEANEALAAFAVNVTAPVDGRIRSIPTAINASAPEVATIGAGVVAVSIMVSEYDIEKVVLDQVVALTIGSSDIPIHGEVSSIAQTPDDSSGVVTYQVVVTSEQIPDTVRVGMTVSATIDVESVDGVVSVPASAITTDTEGRSTVIVLGDRDRIEVRAVKVGLVGNTMVEIVSGVEAGETVVTGAVGNVPASTGGVLNGGTPE